MHEKAIPPPHPPHKLIILKHGSATGPANFNQRTLTFGNLVAFEMPLAVSVYVNALCETCAYTIRARVRES